MPVKRRDKWHVKAELTKLSGGKPELVDQVIEAENAADVRNWLSRMAEMQDAWVTRTRVCKVIGDTGEILPLPVALPSPPPPCQAYKPPCTYKLEGMDPVVLVLPGVKVIGGEA